MRRVVFSLAVILVFSALVYAQAPDRKSQLGIGGGPYILFGDVTVDEGNEKRATPLVYEVLLNNLGGRPADRQYVSSGGRYQFINLAAGQYELVVLLDHQEIGRMRVEVLSGGAERVRQNIELAWKGSTSSKPSSISAADFYKRSDANEKLFMTAREENDQTRYVYAI